MSKKMNFSTTSTGPKEDTEDKVFILTIHVDEGYNRGYTTIEIPLRIKYPITSCMCLRRIRKNDEGFAHFVCGVDVFSNGIVVASDLWEYSFKRLIEKLIDYNIDSMHPHVDEFRDKYKLQDTEELILCDDTEAIVSMDYDESYEKHLKDVAKKRKKTINKVKPFLEELLKQ